MSKSDAAHDTYFEEFAPDMLVELRKGFIFEASDTEEVSSEQQLYEFIGNRARFPRAGRRVSMVRFGGWLSAGRKALDTWALGTQ